MLRLTDWYRLCKRSEFYSLTFLRRARSSVQPKQRYCLENQTRYKIRIRSIGFWNTSLFTKAFAFTRDPLIDMSQYSKIVTRNLFYTRAYAQVKMLVSRTRWKIRDFVLYTMRQIVYNTNESYTVTFNRRIFFLQFLSRFVKLTNFFFFGLTKIRERERESSIASISIQSFSNIYV